MSDSWFLILVLETSVWKIITRVAMRIHIHELRMKIGNYAFLRLFPASYFIPLLSDKSSMGNKLLMTYSYGIDSCAKASGFRPMMHVHTTSIQWIPYHWSPHFLGWTLDITLAVTIPPKYTTKESHMTDLPLGFLPFRLCPWYRFLF